MSARWTPARRAVREALALVFPVECAGCGARDEHLCDDCRDILLASPLRRRRVDAPGGDLDVWSGLDFDGVTARVVRALKEAGRTDLARELAPALSNAIEAAIAEGFAGWAATELVFVPVPTSRAAMRRRGYRVADLLAVRAGHQPRRLLRLSRTAADQRSLGRADRARNVSHSMTAIGSSALHVLIVDDVVTTGATLAEAARALRAAGAQVVGAVTVAATPRRSGPSADAVETHT